MFIDKVQITVQAGNGGNGCDSYYMRTDRKSIPNGGDGGRGGRVIFRADANAAGLESFRYRHHLAAEHGGHGGSEKKRGRGGKDLVVLVRPGTRIFDRQRNLLIRDLKTAGEEVVVAEGGKEGRGNLGGKTNTLGERGMTLELELTATVQADIFLVGLPNSGKSKLINALTRAHLKEETYPFTTQSPEVGVLMLDYEQITLCELPSLYSASHEGRGMGADFLKHLEGACFILFVIDPVSEYAESLKQGLEILREQLKNRSEELLNIPYAVAVNKMDLEEAKARAGKEKFSPKAPVFFISAQTGEGLDKLKEYLGTINFKQESAHESSS